MFPLAHSLFAFAAVALVQGASAVEPHCSIVYAGHHGHFVKDLPVLHLDQTDSVIDLPYDQCYPTWSWQVGVKVTACDPYGAAPQVELLIAERRVRIICAWTDGQQCPDGIDLSFQVQCDAFVKQL